MIEKQNYSFSLDVVQEAAHNSKVLNKISLAHSTSKTNKDFNSVYGSSGLGWKSQFRGMSQNKQ